MKTKIIFILLCFLSLNVMGQGIIRRNKPQTTQTQPSVSKQKPKPAAKATKKQSVKMCDICEKPLSKCDYGGKHPYCQTCGKLKERCEYKGNHPSQQSSTTAVTPTQQTKKTTGTLNGHEWVDLGLSVKWATCNVGATSPEGYGSYFAWGETSPKNSYDWSNLKYCNNTTGDRFSKGDSFSKYVYNSKYGTVDNRTILELSDDAAHANWGSNWRMPTINEFHELIGKCTWTWITINGKSGYKVTSKSNGNSIFLPAAGLKSSSSLNSAGSYGYCWSSSLITSNDHAAYVLCFKSDDVGCYFSGRCNGQSVRPVFR